MSYIILQGTEYPDPIFVIAGMEHNDVSSIYKSYIIQYFITENQAKQYYFQTENIPIKDVCYTIDDIMNTIGARQYSQGLFYSIIPLFYYLTGISEGWTKPDIDFEVEIQTYTTLIEQSHNIDLKDLLISLNFDISNYTGLKKFKENSIANNQMGNLTEDSSVLDWFLYYWKSNCQTDIELKNIVSSVDTAPSLTEEQQIRKENNYSFFESNSDRYEIKQDGSVYDKVQNLWIVGGEN